MKRVCVFGNFSGRNAGDSALLECLMEDVTAVCPDLEFLIPTICPSFVSRTYARFRVRPVSLLPWRGSVKILGIPTVRAALRADLILVTDAILFDRHFWNPLHNYLNTLSRVLPFAARRGIPVGLYNCHLGPVTCGSGRRALRRMLTSAAAIVLRDQDSAELMQSLGVARQRATIGADCALNVQPCSQSRCAAIAAKAGVLQNSRPALGLTLSAYLAAFPGRRQVALREFVQSMSGLIDRLADELNAEVLLLSTHPMDLGVNHAVLEAVRRQDRVCLFSNRDHTHNELVGLMERLDLQVSMRTHALIFAASRGVPVMGISAYPKNAAFLDSVGQAQRMIDLHEDLENDRALEKVLATWHDRETIRAELARTMPAQKQQARQAATRLRPFLLDSQARR